MPYQELKSSGPVLPPGVGMIWASDRQAHGDRLVHCQSEAADPLVLVCRLSACHVEISSPPLVSDSERMQKLGRERESLAFLFIHPFLFSPALYTTKVYLHIKRNNKKEKEKKHTPSTRHQTVRESYPRGLPLNSCPSRHLHIYSCRSA